MKIFARCLRVVLVIVLIVCPVSLNAQKYNKYSDSYNFRKGVEFLEGEDYQSAEDAFRKEISEHNENGYAYFFLAGIQFFNDEYGNALTSLEQALKYIPKKDKIYKGACYYQRAGIFKTLEKYDNALDDYSKAILYNPNDDEALWDRAQLYYELEKIDLADADYKRIIELKPNQPSSYIGLGRNELYRKNYSSAIDIFDNVISLYSSFTHAYTFRAEAYLGVKRYKEAASDVVKSLELGGDKRAFYVMHLVADSAFVHMNTKLKAMTVIDSNNSYWFYCLGSINEESGKYNDAISYYQKALKLNEDATTYYRISDCYKELGEWTYSLEFIDKAIALEPDEAYYLFYKAEIYYEAGHVKTAIEAMDQYIEAVPDYAGGYYRRGWYKDNLKDVDGAIEDYTTCITLTPDYAYAIMSRGNMYLLKGEKELAKKDFEMVIQKDTIPEKGSCTMYALMHLGREEEAIEWMNKMLESSEDEGVRYEAACLYSLMGNTEKSLYYLEESLKRGNKSYNHIMIDDDTDNIKNLDEFKALMKKYFPQEAEAESSDGVIVEYTENVIEIPFTRKGGVTQVKCNINGLPLYFIFDTGAADVVMSRVEATFMFKNNYLSPGDVIGKARYMDANGDVNIGTVLNIKKIEFGGLELENVRASVVESTNAPLLLGQSVLNRLGKIEIDYDRSVLKITSRKKQTLATQSNE